MKKNHINPPGPSRGESLAIHNLRINLTGPQTSFPDLLDTFFQAAAGIRPNDLMLAERAANCLTQGYDKDPSISFLVRAVARAIGTKYQERAVGCAPLLRAY